MVTGISIGFPVIEPFVWTSDGGMTGLGFYYGQGTSSYASSISGNGTVVVGSADDGNPNHGLVPFRWTAATGMVRLGHLPGKTSASAAAVSSDGSVVVGASSDGLYSEAVIWRADGHVIGLGDFPSEDRGSAASGVSADGSVVVGWGRSESGYEAFRWTQSQGLVPLGDLPGGFYSSFANAVSADGLVVVGSSNSGRNPEAFRWTAESGMVGLGDLPGGAYSSVALAASADGAVIVGNSHTGGITDVDGAEAFVWDQKHGMRRLAALLASAGASLAGWELRSAESITPDGRIVVGWGINPRGHTEAWIADISSIVPEPRSGILVYAASLIAACVTRSRSLRHKYVGPA